MEDMGVITPSSSEWAAPIALVPKKDGSPRFCVDYQGLNRVARFDACQMPRMDDINDKRGKAKDISTLNLTRGYWQVPLEEHSREKTALTTLFGMYEFATIPFRLQGAPTTFQRMMDQVLCRTEEFAAALLDDLVVFNATWEEHIKHLRERLRQLREACLTAKLKKCYLAMRETMYLGHVVGSGEVKPELDKVKAVREFPRPVITKDVRYFLGLTGKENTNADALSRAFKHECV